MATGIAVLNELAFGVASAEDKVLVRRWASRVGGERVKVVHSSLLKILDGFGSTELVRFLSCFDGSDEVGRVIEWLLALEREVDACASEPCS